MTKQRPDDPPAFPEGTFLDYLVSRGLLQSGAAKTIENETASRNPEYLCDVLCQGELLSREDACMALASYYGQPYIDLRTTTFDPAALQKIPADVARHYTAIPFFLLDGEIAVAMPEVDLDAVEALGRIAGCHVDMHLAVRAQILDAIAFHYFTGESGTQPVKVEALGPAAKLDGEGAEIQQMVHGLIVSAIRERASDIHLEPEEGFCRIRFRVDGLLREERQLPLELLHPLVARCKVMAGLNIAESRRPQDGRIHLDIGSRSFDIRMSVVPSKNFEKVVLRILDKSGVSLDIDQSYVSGRILDNLKKIISGANGFLLVTGPTGSGKTTFCYALINRLNAIHRNIVTIEDPVEYRFPLVTQIQVHHEINMDFPRILRSVLRQDPDVIFVGEIRDRETARVATEAALTGHLVVSTIHTNNAVQAVTRLVEIGVEPFMVAPSLEGVFAQRLVRRLCPRCRETVAPTAAERACFRLAPGDGAALRLYRSGGCVACHGTGYQGRLAIHELVTVTDEIRALIMRGAPVAEMEQAAVRGGYRPMRYDGLKKALIGLTAVDEVVRVTMDREDVAS